ncbi:MAG: AAA family ATPase [Ignavibacterium sp.]|nr:AAA family ATPase [Ignavibacterium sp.]
MENNLSNRIDLTELQTSIEKVKAEIKKIIVGQDKVIELLLAAIFADGHVLIEGVPGIAKTLIAKILTRTISADFSRIQFTPDLMPSDILGTSIFNMKSSEFEFKKVRYFQTSF